MAIEKHDCPVRAVTSGPRAHFFGYYDKPPWDATGRFLLALEADDLRRMPRPGEKAAVGLIDPDSGRFQPVAETRAWNWQQGCMLRWLPPASDREIIFNDCIDGRLVAVILDVRTGRRRTLPRPIYDVSPDGRWAVTLNFARLAHARPIVGYAGAADPWQDDPHPADDGIYRMDLSDGRDRLIISLDEVVRHRANATMTGVIHRFEHLKISPDGGRLFFLHRWPRAGKGRPFHDRLFTIGVDGSDLFLLAGDDLVSHFDWRDGGHILAWARVAGRGDHFYLFTDRSHRAEIVGRGVLTRDGHCSYSPNRHWILGDAYPGAESRCIVWLYGVASGRRIDVGSFHAPPELYRTAGIRCDLHPRWSRDGRLVCIDSAHEQPRQMYVIDVSGVSGRRQRR
jgi:hypothetical protein